MSHGCEICEDLGLVWTRQKAGTFGYSFFAALRCPCGITFPRGPNEVSKAPAGWSSSIPTFTEVGLKPDDVYSESQRTKWETEEWEREQARLDPEAVAERDAIQGEHGAEVESV